MGISSTQAVSCSTPSDLTLTIPCRGCFLFDLTTCAEVARTIVDLMTHGTLATVGEDNIPLGTYASYVLDSQGQPILRLRQEAVHTANLLRNPQCSLFIQPDDMPARILARATLIGKVGTLLHCPTHLLLAHCPPSGSSTLSWKPRTKADCGEPHILCGLTY